MTSRTSPLRTSQVAINPPANKLDDVKRRHTLMNSALKCKSGVLNQPNPIDDLGSNRKAAKSTVVLDGYYKPNGENKIDLMAVKEETLPKNIKSLGGAGTLTNDSIIQ